jgi:hypothetical protein
MSIILAFVFGRSVDKELFAPQGYTDLNRKPALLTGHWFTR